MDKRKNAILKNLINEIDCSLGQSEEVIKFIIDKALKDTDAYKDDDDNYVFDIYELLDYTNNIIRQCKKFIESFIEEKPNE